MIDYLWFKQNVFVIWFYII